jgi:hypothetical protein
MYKITWKIKLSDTEYSQNFPDYDRMRMFYDVLWETPNVNEVCVFEYIGGFTR